MAIPNPEFDVTRVGSFDFSPAIAHTLDLKRISGKPLPTWGAMAVGFRVQKAAGVQFYATDFIGEEIHGSRRQAVVGQPCVFFGPNIFAICATGDASAQDVVAFTSIAQNIEYTLLANVGPAFEPANKPMNVNYDGQSYLSKTGLSPEQALALRQTADSLARGGIGPAMSAGWRAPLSPRLDTYVHRRQPTDISRHMKQFEVVRQAVEHLDDIRNNPFWSYDIDAAAAVRGSDKLSVPVGPMLQLLARLGPVEALTLGQAVTVPTAGELIVDQRVAYDGMRNVRLPFPLIRVSGQFYDTGINRVVEEFAFAGLDLPIAGRLFDSAEQTDAHRPQTLDGPAHADIEIFLAKNASALTYFLATGAADDQIVTGVAGFPKPYLIQTPEPNANNPGGRPSLRHGPVDLPFDKPQDQPLRLYPRDMFGRWPIPDDGACQLRPWPVGAPGLISTLVEYFDDHNIAIRIAVQWDRTIRRQRDILLSIKLVAVKPNDATALDAPFAPAEGVTCPAFPAGSKLAIVFDADGNPSINPKDPPSGLGVQLIRSMSEPDSVGGAETPKLQLYEVTVPLGRAADLMALLTDGADRLFAQIVGDASEKVSGDRRTDPPLPRLTKVIDDPRPPVILAEPWQIYWTGLPNVTTGEARALLALPAHGAGPAPLGYNVWQANETAVLEFILRWEFSDKDAVTRGISIVRHERDMPARLALFQPLIEKSLSDTEFKQGFTALFRANSTTPILTEQKRVEIVLPARQTGFEFLMFTAVSAAGIETPKEPRETLRILAVPDRRPIPTPSLRIITTDDTGFFELSGLCLAIVGYPKPFEASTVRFFWDSGNIADSDELLSTLTPVSEFTVKQAAAYLSDIQEIIANGVPFPYVRLFLLKPSRRTRDRHHFAVDFKSPNSTSPLDQIPSLRSQLQSHFLQSESTDAATRSDLSF